MHFTACKLSQKINKLVDSYISILVYRVMVNKISFVFDLIGINKNIYVNHVNGIGNLSNT